jgi:4-alpha-glucanotransferase
LTPAARCVAPDERLDGRRVFGLWANLYSLRSERGLGFGDLGDLHRLIRFAGDAGAAFVGMNPLHVLRNRGHSFSPYSPLSRLFRNPLYLELEAIPEWADCEGLRQRLASVPMQRELAALRAAERLDPERVAAAQAPLLEALHRSFAARHRGRDTARGREYARYREEQGPLLDDFAVFRALEDHLAGQGHGRDWRAWPARYRSPRSDAVSAFAREQAETVDLHAFVQFELDRQLAAAAAAAERAGLVLGLYRDLALGSAASGFDPWAFPDLFVMEASVGAPPDAYSDTGQDWGFPPLSPERLADADGGYIQRLLAAVFAHAGAVRIDHVMGLFRQWWVPAGRSAREGRYVAYPARQLLAAVVLASRRQGALVVGEDLGTLPPGLGPRLARRGLLSSRVLYFERERDGRFRPAARYSRRALVTANTHDLPTLPAFWTGRDLEIRRELGLLADDAALARAREARGAERRALLSRLRRDGLLASEAPDVPDLCAAVHAFLCGTPSPLVGISLDDLAGETEPVNVPGVGQERYPSWTRRMRLDLEALASDAGVDRALAGARTRRLA